MQTFQQRKAIAQRKSLDMLPPDKRPVLAMPVLQNPCGGCTACCHVHAIRAVDKPPFLDCSHQCAAGCDLHGVSKPDECAHYYCGYAFGAVTGGVEMRPDNLGLIVDFRMSINSTGVENTDHGDMIAIWEYRPDAALANYDFIDRICEIGKNTILVPYGAPPTGEGRRIWHIKLVGHKIFRGLWQVHRDRAKRCEEIRCLIDTMEQYR